MEYVRGVDLRTIIRRAKLRRRELSPAAALHIALEVLAGLAYAHTRRDPDRRLAGHHPPRRLAVEHPLLGRRAR